MCVLAIILRTEGLIIIKEDYAWCMKLIIILQGKVTKCDVLGLPEDSDH